MKEMSYKSAIFTLVNPYFASKSPEHDVTRTLVPANHGRYEIFVYTCVWCKIDVLKGTAGFVSMPPLVWQIL